MIALYLKQDEVIRILNMVYAVLLGVLARFALQQSGGASSPLEIHTLITSSNYIPVGLLSLYFIVDWLSTNITLPTKAQVVHVLLLPMIVGVVALGGLVAFAFVPSCTWGICFGGYAFIVPWYDLYKTDSDREQNHALMHKLAIYTFFSLRAATGLLILCITLFKAWREPTGQLTQSDTSLFGWIGIYVVLKLARFWFFAKF